MNIKIISTSPKGVETDCSYLADLLDEYIKRVILNNAKVTLNKLDGTIITYEYEREQS